MSDPTEPTAGPECPRCGCRRLSVYKTRREGESIIRYRSCDHCDRRGIITKERMTNPKEDPRRSQNIKWTPI